MRRPPVLQTEQANLASWGADVVRALKELQGVPFLNGTRLNNVTVGSTETLVPHKLGRVPQGFFWINPSANTTIWQPAAPDKTNIHLQAGSAVVVDLWVF